MTRSRPFPDRGSATLLAVAFLGVVVLIGCALGVVSGMVVAHRTAQGSADLAALAGAAALADGEDACSQAVRVAAANRARVEDCAVDGREVTVSVTVSGPRWLGRQDKLSARARAGPA